MKADAVLMDVLRSLGCKSIKCGCETTNCGLCTVWINGKSRLSCSVLAASVDGCEITTLEGVEEEAAEFGRFLAAEGGEQCGFCSPGFIMNVLAMKRELQDPDTEIYGGAEREGGAGMNMTGDHTAKSSAEEMRIVNHVVPKVDSEALVTGKAVYTNDLAPADCLIVKIIRSPHAHALIKEINTERAKAVPGIEWRARPIPSPAPMTG